MFEVLDFGFASFGVSDFADSLFLVPVPAEFAVTTGAFFSVTVFGTFFLGAGGGFAFFGVTGFADSVFGGPEKFLIAGTSRAGGFVEFTDLGDLGRTSDEIERVEGVGGGSEGEDGEADYGGEEGGDEECEE